MTLFKEDTRVISTARSIDEINAAVEKGFGILLLPCNPSPPYLHTVSLYKHKMKGTYRLDLDPRLSYRDPGEYAQWQHALALEYYPPVFKEGFAAYLIPADLEIGERVWLEDLIEDFLGCVSGQGLGETRLQNAYARWNGSAFDIEYDTQNVGVIIG